MISPEQARNSLTIVHSCPLSVIGIDLSFLMCENVLTFTSLVFSDQILEDGERLEGLDLADDKKFVGHYAYGSQGCPARRRCSSCPSPCHYGSEEGRYDDHGCCMHPWLRRLRRRPGPPPVPPDQLPGAGSPPTLPLLCWPARSWKTLSRILWTWAMIVIR